MDIANQITIREATLADQVKVYRWLYYADSSRLINSLDAISTDSIPSFETFRTDFEDYFFTGTHPEKGRSYIIQYTPNITQDIGTIHYTSFHLQKGIAELDMWMKAEAYCGKGFGPVAIQLLARQLRQKGFHQLIIRPSRKNQRAIQAYLKAGFREAKLEPEHIYQPEYVAVYGPGDYGAGNDVFMVMELL